MRVARHADLGTCTPYIPPTSGPLCSPAVTPIVFSTPLWSFGRSPTPCWMSLSPPCSVSVSRNT